MAPPRADPPAASGTACASRVLEDVANVLLPGKPTKDLDITAIREGASRRSSAQPALPPPAPLARAGRVGP